MAQLEKLRVKETKCPPKAHSYLGKNSQLLRPVHSFKETWFPISGTIMEHLRTLRGIRAGSQPKRVPLFQILKVYSLYNSYFLCDRNVICASFPHWPIVTRVFHTMWHQPVPLSPVALMEPNLRAVFAREKNVLLTFMPNCTKCKH